MPKITTNDLIYLNNAGRALKQRDFVVCNQFIVGIDNISNYLAYIDLDLRKISSDLASCESLYRFNAKDLSAFVKSITIETEFEIINDTITSNTGEQLCLTTDHGTALIIIRKLALIRDMGGEGLNWIDINTIGNKIKDMVKGDGAIYEVVDGHYMTIFPSIIPLNKPDKLYVAFIGETDEVFTAKFRIVKKDFTMMVCISYLKI